MKERLAYAKAAPAAFRAMLALQQAVSQLGLESRLLDLVYLRASQINGCAFCIDAHWTDLIKAGERPERLYLLSAWREADLYTDRERAAFAWTEAVTLVSEGHVPEAVYAIARAQFAEAELVHLTLAINTINSWNRLAISFRKTPAVVAAQSAPASTSAAQ